MTHTLQDKPSLVTVPFRQVVTKAGEITSTVQDTSTWTPLENGLNIKDGYLALSTSASTTVTNCETLYPQLWANAPTAWRSGSDLIIPAQGVPNTTDWIDYTNANYGSDFGNSTWEYLKYKKTGNTISLKGALVAGSTFAPGSSLTLDLIPNGLSPLNPVNYLQIAGNVGYLKSGSNYGNAGYASFFQPVSSWLILFNTSGSTGANQSAFVNTTNPFTWAAGDKLEFVLQDIEIDEEGITPVISLFNNVASSSIGLPDATADSKGLTSLNQASVAPVNHLINGGDFWQRGTAFADITFSEYTADRWKGRRGSQVAGMNISRSILFPSGAVVRNSIEVKRDDAQTNELRLGQQIESDRCYQLAGKKATVGVNILENSGASWTTGKIQIRYSTVKDESLDVFGGTFVDEHILTPTNNAVWRTEGFTFDVPADCAAMIVVFEYTPSGATFASDEVRLNEPRLYEGDKLYNFVRAGITYEGELALCQRYYETGYAYFYGVKGARIGSSVQYAVKKRDSPTFNTNEVFGDAEISGVSVNSVTDLGSFAWFSNTGLTAGNNVQYSFTWEAEDEL
jgi:hypothetical protein